jgi:uncharacterized protein YraI
MLQARWGMCFLLLLFMTSWVSAQGAPQPVADALADLNQRLGKNLKLTDFNWTWREQLFQNEAMGCARLDKGNVNNIIGYVVELTVDGLVYDYRVANNPRIFFLCSPYTAPTSTPTNTPTATNTPVPTSALPSPTPSQCGALRSRLIIGLPARVTPGEPNNVREGPGASAKFVGEIPGEGVFNVLDGPRCSPDGAWWRIDFNGLVGWTLEGKDSIYYVEPMSMVLPPSATPQLILPSPTFQPTFTPTRVIPTATQGAIICDAAIPPRLKVGQQGRVTPGLPNNMRDLPGQSSNYVGEIPALGVFTVLDGPRCTGDGAWWQVSYNGMVGWTIEGSDGEYWTEPLTIGGATITTANAAQLRPLLNWIPISANAGFAITDAGLLITADDTSVTKWIVADSSAPIGSWSWANLTFPVSDRQLQAAVVTAQSELLVHGAGGQDSIIMNPETNDILATPLNSEKGVFAPDGTWLALITLNGTLEIVDLQRGSATFGKSIPLARVHTQLVDDVAISADGTFMASVSDAEVVIWDTATWQSRTLPLPTVGRVQRVYDVQFSLDATRVAVSVLEKAADGTPKTTGTVFIWNTSDGSTLSPRTAFDGMTYAALAFLPDGALLAAGGTGDGTALTAASRAQLVMWDLTASTTGVIAEDTGYYNQMQLNPARTLAFTHNAASRAVHLWAVQ